MAASDAHLVQECRELCDKIPADLAVEKQFMVAPRFKLALFLTSARIVTDLNI